MKKLTTVWFEKEDGPKLFSSNFNRIQIHEFSKDQQNSFFQLIKNDFKDKEGVYLLLGEDKENRDIYIGEAENLKSRLYDHSKDDSKRFTNRIALITSKDELDQISKDQLHYIEKELIRKFTITPDYNVKNGNKGQGNMNDVIQKLFLEEEVQVIHSGLEALGISLKDNIKHTILKSDFIETDIEDQEIYTNIPHTKININAILHSDKSITILKDQVIKHKSRENRFGKEIIKKSLDSAKYDDRIKISGDEKGYIVEYIEDVRYKSWSSSLYLIKGGIEASSLSWKSKKTNKGLKI